MSYYQSVGVWLREIRDNIEYYEPLSIFTSLEYTEQPPRDARDEVLCATDHGTKNSARRSVNEDIEEYEKIWEAGFALPVYFAEESTVSALFCESVEDLRVSPVVYETVEFDFGEDVMLWRHELRFECQEEESILESEEFINSINIEDEASHSFPKPQKFPVLEEQVVVRKKTQPNTVRAKTLNYDLSGLSQGRLNEIKGVSKIVIGEELCAKINRHERLVFDEKEIHIIGRSGKNKMIKDQVELRPGVQQVDKKNVVLHDVNNVPIQLFFDTSKDAKCFVDSERLHSPLSEKSSIKTKLLRLLGKRSSREFLVEKGIYMNESIFGNTIQNIYQMQDRVPEFLTRSMQLIEKPNNISQVGIYRTSGNLATIQKIRFQVDKGDLSVLDQYCEDVDVLTGALKLFFRELKEPLIPLATSDELLEISDKNPEEINRILHKLPKANYESLMCLLRHLLNIVEHKDTNKMDIYNLTICWGPSLMFVPDDCLDIMTQSSNNSKVLDILLTHFKDHPKDLSNSLEQIDVKARIAETKYAKEPEPLKGHKKSSSCSNINDVVHDVVTRMVEMIEVNAKTEGLYRKSGSQVKIDKIAKKLAKGKLNEIEKVKADIHDFAGALRKYVNELAEPLAPKKVFEECTCDNFNYGVVKMKLKRNVDTLKRKELLTILLKHMVRVLHEEKSNKTTLADVCSYWKNAIIKTNQDDKFKTKLLEILLDTYGDYKVTVNEIPKPMPDVIKDIQAMARFSKYENVNLTPHARSDKDSIRGEAKILEDKTDNEEK